MPVSVPFTGKPRVSGAGHFLADAAEISPDGVRERDLDRPFFKSHPDRVGQRCTGEMGSLVKWGLIFTLHI
jgi:hypothetical protein